MTEHEAASSALKNGKVRQILLIEDEGYDLFRIVVVYTHEGTQYEYQSKPFCGFTPQDFGCEIAKRLERLGMSRKAAISWIQGRIDTRQIDCDALFVKGLCRQGRIPPSVMASVRSQVRANGGDFSTTHSKG